MPRHECQNCEKDWSHDEIKPIKDLHERVASGEPMPSGECPDCGALTHEIKHYKQWVMEERHYGLEYIVAAVSIEEAKNKVIFGETVHEGKATLHDITNREPMDDLELVGGPPVKTEVALIPGLSTPEGQKRMNDALEKRNRLDYECYMLLAGLVDDGFFRMGARNERPKSEDLKKEVHTLVRDRTQANDEFIKATAGRSG